MGGDSSEREISLSTGKMVLGALNPEQFEAFGVDPSQLHIEKGSVRGLVDFITNEKPDVAFIALHGVRGEDGCIQGLLEIVGIPYTGPGVLASAVAMDKRLTKDVLTAAGVLVPKGVAVTRSEGASDEILKTINATLKYPLIAKPNAEGSTIGVTRIYKPEELADGIKHAHSYDDLALVEELIEGVEISAAVLGNEVVEVLPLVEIVPTSGFYDFTAKYTPGATDEICPARLPEDRAEEASEIAKRTYKTLGCRGFARVDMIVTPDRIVVLEANTVPGMTATSLFPRCAKVAGIEFPDLLARIINLALEGKR
jgi:D-alanine-D-alanine ligase